MANATHIALALGALAVLLLGAAGALAAARWRLRRRWRRTRRRAARAEDRAATVLKRAGYRIVGVQEAVAWPVEVDGEVREVTLRADYLVERDGWRFVAEVKTGAKAPNPRSSATRRQLLEYRLAYDVDGVLLVDMEDGSILEVEFPALEARLAGDGEAGLRSPLALAGFGLALGLAAWALLR